MLSRLAKWVFEDEENAAGLCALITTAVAFILQKWSWWIPTTLLSSIALGGIIMSVWFHDESRASQSKNKQEPFLTRSNLICLLTGIVLGMLVLDLFHLNFFNTILILVVYQVIFLVVHHNFYEKKVSVI